MKQAQVLTEKDTKSLIGILQNGDNILRTEPGAKENDGGGGGGGNEDGDNPCYACLY